MAISGWDLLRLFIPNLKRFYLRRINVPRKTKEKIANRLAWIYTIPTFIVILILLGVIIFFGTKYEVPVIKPLGDRLGIKYLCGADKFAITIDGTNKVAMGENKTISFMVDSYKQRQVRIKIYLRPYDKESYIPSFKYPTEQLLSEGETKDNIIPIAINSPVSKGTFEICITIDDDSFFGINKYKDCPSTLEVTNPS